MEIYNLYFFRITSSIYYLYFSFYFVMPLWVKENIHEGKKSRLSEEEKREREREREKSEEERERERKIKREREREIFCVHKHVYKYTKKIYITQKAKTLFNNNKINIFSIDRLFKGTILQASQRTKREEVCYRDAPGSRLKLVVVLWFQLVFVQ